MKLDDAKRLARAVSAGISVLSILGCEIADETATSETAPNYAAEAGRVIEALDVTGMTAVVMVEGEIVYQDAFGLADASTERPVTTDMLFPIGSVSKAFTTTALAILVDRGAIEWDAPITTYISEFEMSDPWVTKNFSVRDAVTHRSGLPLGAGDLLFWPDAEGDVSDVIDALPHLQPATGFRTEYAYDNLLYIVAGEVIARASGQSWADFITDEIFEPLGMTDCAADRSRIREGAKVATGHQRPIGSNEPRPVDEAMLLRDWVAPAGGIYCSAGDMMKWSQFWFDSGLTSDGERLVSDEQIAELWKGVTPIPVGVPLEQRGSVVHALYALGWGVQDFQGSPLVTHTGGVPGVFSNLILLPKQQIAIFASNNDKTQASVAWTLQLADGFIGEQDRDYIELFGGEAAGALEQERSVLVDALATPSDAAAPTLPLGAYAGDYEDAWYGRVRIEEGPDGLAIDMSRSEVLDGPLTHFDGDVFLAAWPDRSLKADAYVTFTVENGAVTGFKMKAVSATTDFSYNFHDLNLVRVQAGE